MIFLIIKLPINMLLLKEIIYYQLLLQNFVSQHLQKLINFANLLFNFIFYNRRF
jgi:hypothetical protein